MNYPLPDSPTVTTLPEHIARATHPATGADIQTWLLMGVVCLLAAGLLFAINYAWRPRG